MKTDDINRIIEEMQKHLSNRNDPVTHCELYIKEGCSHVDGFLCDMDTCDIRQKFLNGTLESTEDQYEVGTLEGAEEFSKKRNYPLGKKFENLEKPPDK